MKKIFTLAVAMVWATGIMAQMHGAMNFAGESKINVSTMEIVNASDTVTFAMADMTSGDITLPEMKGMGTIPSFTIEGAAFSLGADRIVTFSDQTFETTVDVDGVEKKITGTSLSGTFNMTDNVLTLTVVFKYGAMPFPMTYTITSYYVKAVTNAITVAVGGAFNYASPSVTYNVRKYKKDGVEVLDVEVPQYNLSGTVMGDLTLGSYVIKGLVYDEEHGGYFRDYRDDGLKFHFIAEQNGTKTMDADYAFSCTKDNNILVKYSGKNITSIVNTFQMGAMPFGIVTTFENITSGIENVNTTTTPKHLDNAVYNLRGQRVSADTKGLVIINGKKVFRKIEVYTPK